MHFLSLKKHSYKHLIDVTATPQMDYRKAPTFQGAEQGSAQNRTEQSPTYSQLYQLMSKIAIL